MWVVSALLNHDLWVTWITLTTSPIVALGTGPFCTAVVCTHPHGPMVHWINLNYFKKILSWQTTWPFILHMIYETYHFTILHLHATHRHTVAIRASTKHACFTCRFIHFFPPFGPGMKIMVQLLSSGLWSDGFPDRWTTGWGGRMECD